MPVFSAQDREALYREIKDQVSEEAIASFRGLLAQTLDADFVDKLAEKITMKDALINEPVTNFVVTSDRQVVNGQPNDRQLQIINSKLPQSVNPEDVGVATFAASHNLISLSKGVWDIGSLQAMARSFPEGKGRPFEINHDWENVNSVVGFIFDARLMKSDRAPRSVSHAQSGKFAKENKKIVDRDGFIWLEIDVAYDAQSDFARRVKMGTVGDVSTGGLKDPNGIACPICTEEQGQMIQCFTDDRCEHIPPLPMLEWFLDFEDEEIQKRMMPYYIRNGFHTAIEVSSVIKGDLPGAEIVIPGDRFYR